MFGVGVSAANGPSLVKYGSPDGSGKPSSRKLHLVAPNATNSIISRWPDHRSDADKRAFGRAPSVVGYGLAGRVMELIGERPRFRPPPFAHFKN